MTKQKIELIRQKCNLINNSLKNKKHDIFEISKIFKNGDGDVSYLHIFNKQSKKIDFIRINIVPCDEDLENKDYEVINFIYELLEDKK